MSLNVTTWHHRGGMSGQANLTYIVDPDTGEQIPVVYGVDQWGNPTLVTPDNQAPWYSSLLQSGVQTAGNIFGSRNYNNYGLPYGGGPGGGAAITASASPGGIGAGLNLSTNTLILIGLVAAVFLFGKGRR